jgi:gas vesicle protein
MSNSSRTFFSFLAGVATGAAIGILYAPEKGEITRDKLSYRLSKYREQLQKFINDLIDRENEVIMGATGADSSAKIEGQKVVSEARQKAEKLLEDVESLMSQIKSKH